MLFADDDVLQIGRGEEGEAIGLLLAGFVADKDDDLVDAGDLGLLDCLNLPHGVRIEAEIGLHEGIHDFLGGRVGGEVGGIGLRESRGAAAGAAGAGAVDGCGGGLILRKGMLDGREQAGPSAVAAASRAEVRIKRISPSDGGKTPDL